MNTMLTLFAKNENVFYCSHDKMHASNVILCHFTFVICFEQQKRVSSDLTNHRRTHLAIATNSDSNQNNYVPNMFVAFR